MPPEKIALVSKRSTQNCWSWFQFTQKRIFYPINFFKITLPKVSHVLVDVMWPMFFYASSGQFSFLLKSESRWQLPRMTPYIRFCSCQLSASSMLSKKIESDPDFKEHVKVRVITQNVSRFNSVHFYSFQFILRKQKQNKHTCP